MVGKAQMPLSAVSSVKLLEREIQTTNIATIKHTHTPTHTHIVLYKVFFPHTMPYLSLCLVGALIVFVVRVMLKEN